MLTIVEAVSVIRGLWAQTSEKNREYMLAYISQLANGKNPVEAAKALATAYVGETAAEELLKRELG